MKLLNLYEASVKINSLEKCIDNSKINQQTKGSLIYGSTTEHTNTLLTTNPNGYFGSTVYSFLNTIAGGGSIFNTISGGWWTVNRVVWEQGVTGDFFASEMWFPVDPINQGSAIYTRSYIDNDGSSEWTEFIALPNRSELTSINNTLNNYSSSIETLQSSVAILQATDLDSVLPYDINAVRGGRLLKGKSETAFASLGSYINDAVDITGSPCLEFVSNNNYQYLTNSPVNVTKTYRLRLTVSGVNFGGKFSPYFHLFDKDSVIVGGMYVNFGRFPFDQGDNRTIAVPTNGSAYSVDLVFGGGVGAVTSGLFPATTASVALAFAISTVGSTPLGIVRVSNITLTPLDVEELIPVSQIASVPNGVIMQDFTNNRLVVKNTSGVTKYISLT